MSVLCSPRVSPKISYCGFIVCSFKPELGFFYHFEEVHQGVNINGRYQSFVICHMSSPGAKQDLLMDLVYHVVILGKVMFVYHMIS